MRELEDRDPSDSLRITIFVNEGDENEAWVRTKTDEMKKWVDGVYVRELETKRGTMFTLDTKVRVASHPDFKKFIFQARIKFAENCKIR